MGSTQNPLERPVGGEDDCVFFARAYKAEAALAFEKRAEPGAGRRIGRGHRRGESSSGWENFSYVDNQSLSRWERRGHQEKGGPG